MYFKCLSWICLFHIFFLWSSWLTFLFLKVYLCKLFFWKWNRIFFFSLSLLVPFLILVVLYSGGRRGVPSTAVEKTNAPISLTFSQSNSSTTSPFRVPLEPSEFFLSFSSIFVESCEVRHLGVIGPWDVHLPRAL